VRNKSMWIALLVVILTSGCASTAIDKNASVSPEVATRAKFLMNNLERVTPVTNNLAVKGVMLCDRTEMRFPLSATSNVAGPPQEYRTALWKTWGLDEKVRIVSIADENLNALGIGPHDVIEEVNGKKLDDFEVKALFDAVASASKEDKPLTLVVKTKDGSEKTVSVRAIKGCVGNVVATDKASDMTRTMHMGDPMALMDGGLVALAQNDDELAFLLGREIYYTSQRAGAIKTAVYSASALRGVLDVFTLGLAVVIPVHNMASQGVQSAYAGDADIFALDLMALAGYRPEAALALWERVDSLPVRPSHYALSPGETRRKAVAEKVAGLAKVTGMKGGVERIGDSKPPSETLEEAAVAPSTSSDSSSIEAENHAAASPDGRMVEALDLTGSPTN
jgi:hypothetical protein